MRRLIILFTILLFSSFTFGQRIVGKIIYRYSKPYSVDTIIKGKTSKFTVSADTILDVPNIKILNVTKVTSAQIKQADSLIKNDLFNAIVYTDSIGFASSKYDTTGPKITAKDF